ncbi:hypothetical protein [Fibrobacter succinogenes]|uniref:hypothetical protein n=1 Tax=Fibrobacter succinogenes TaxID=833 RepID=UPI0011B24072|nr:hypothetical protein [Fibrobacter succinogenes]
MIRRSRLVSVIPATFVIPDPVPGGNLLFWHNNLMDPVSRLRSIQDDFENSKHLTAYRISVSIA